MKNSQKKKPAPKPIKPKEDVSFDESVCSAEFSEGCTLPVSEQLKKP